MHIVVAFVILAALAAGFADEHIPPENEFLFSAGKESNIRLRINMAPHSEIIFRNVIKQSHDYSCGSAALATLLNYSLGENLTEKQVIYGMLKHGDAAQIKRLRAFSLFDMQSLCHILGYEAQGYRAELKELENPEYWPCIIPITFYGYTHFVVFKGIYAGHVFVADPFRGNSSYTLSQFEKMWHNNIIFLVSAGPSNRNGLDLLRLSEEDLLYVREDTARDIMLNTIEPFQLPPEFEMNNIPGEWQFGRPPYY
jgi:predicted double-glycine peptidase